MTEIIEGNKLIAEFIGASVNKAGDFLYFKLPDNKAWRVENLKYHTSWDWLMHAVEKIIHIPYVDNEPELDYPYMRTFGMLDLETGFPMVRINRQPLFIAETLIEATWTAVVEFIKWYNQQTQPT